MKAVRLRRAVTLLVTAGCLGTGCSPADDAPVACKDLADYAVLGTAIASAATVAAGALESPGAVVPGPAPPDYSKLPAFCRVRGSIRPSPDSDVRFELWLPAEGWNGRFMQTGNGGAAGNFVYASMAEPVSRGYAVANTDTGHQGDIGDFSWAVGHPEKYVDYQYRAVRELTRVGKALVTAHYGSAPQKSYWMGCSTGGRQGLMEAQRFPADYDAIIAGAPANNWNPLTALSIHIQKNLGPGGLPVEKLGLLRDAATVACDAADGVSDGVIGDPDTCDFDPASLLCGDEGAEHCLGPAEVAAAQRIYAGVVTSDGNEVMPGTGAGSERLWGAYRSRRFEIGTNYFRHVVANEPDWDPATFDPDVDVPRMEAADRGETAAMDPDLSGFVANGGRLLLYHGTADGLIPYRNTVNYYEAVVERLGPGVRDSARLFLVPGMDHCRGGDGAFDADWLTAMEAWAENGDAPDVIGASHPASIVAAPGESTAFTRPLCPWPARAEYSGSGDDADAGNYRCVAP